MKSLLRALFPKQRSRSRQGRQAFPQPQPDEVFYAIGDVHGRADLLVPLVERIDSIEPGMRIVFMGDYIDRGLDSRGVIDYLRALQRPAAPPSVCLLGNHERMCLDFLENPELSAERWLRNGGLETVASYQVPFQPGGDPVDLRDRLLAAMGPETRTWLEERPVLWRSGNMACVHAAADPEVPLEMQAYSTLIWGHPDFFRRARRDGIWIVHGHTIMDEPTAQAGRVSTDTGAYASGRLTAARIAPGDIRFFSV